MNYRRVVGAVHRVCAPAPEGLGISQRSVTVSTVGLVPAIRRLTEEGLSVRLAVSLHISMLQTLQLHAAFLTSWL